jgi:hypothetical protein
MIYTCKQLLQCGPLEIEAPDAETAAREYYVRRVFDKAVTRIFVSLGKQHWEYDVHLIAVATRVLK